MSKIFYTRYDDCKKALLLMVAYEGVVVHVRSISLLEYAINNSIYLILYSLHSLKVLLEV